MSVTIKEKSIDDTIYCNLCDDAMRRVCVFPHIHHGTSVVITPHTMQTSSSCIEDRINSNWQFDDSYSISTIRQHSQKSISLPNKVNNEMVEEGYV